MMIFTGLHWASMPPSRVETIDPRTLHISGEFVECNLGTAVEAGRQGHGAARRAAVLVRAAVHRSCRPRCRSRSAARATDVDPRLRRRHDERERDADPRLRRDVHDDVQEDGRAPDAVPRVLRHRARGDVGARPGRCRRRSSCAKARKRRKAELCSSLGSSCSRTSGSRSSRSRPRIVLGEWQMYVRSPLLRLGQQSRALLPLGHRARHRDGLRAADARRDGLRLRDHRARAQASADRRCAGRGRGFWLVVVGTVMAAVTDGARQGVGALHVLPADDRQRRSTTSASCWSSSARGSGSR